eukprot:Em0690g2a
MAGLKSVLDVIKDAEDVLVSTNINSEERKKYCDVVKKLDDFFKVRRNVIFERARFNRRSQDRIVVGIRDSALSQRLQLDPDLTLEKAMKVARQREAVQEQQEILREAADSKELHSTVIKHKQQPQTGQSYLSRWIESVRICVDLRPLNESVLRENFPLPKVDENLAQLSGATVFSKLDANCGFWQIPLAKHVQLLTTFITPFGRYCFTKLPFGISCAPELFQKRMSDILQDIEGKLCQMDDVLVFGSSQEEHDDRLKAVLKRIEEAEITKPLRELLSSRNCWLWGSKHDEAFLKLKKEVTKPSILAHYNPQCEVKISADASSFGLGAALLQKENNEWRPVAFASRRMTETEQRYAQIEKEALAIIWACDKFSCFVIEGGSKFTDQEVESFADAITDAIPIVQSMLIKFRTAQINDSCQDHCRHSLFKRYTPVTWEYNVVVLEQEMQYGGQSKESFGC